MVLAIDASVHPGARLSQEGATVEAGVHSERRPGAPPDDLEGMLRAGNGAHSHATRRRSPRTSFDRAAEVGCGQPILLLRVKSSGGCQVRSASGLPLTADMTRAQSTFG